MKNLVSKLLIVAASVACTGLLLGCGQTASQQTAKEVESEESIMEETNASEEQQENTEATQENVEEEQEDAEEVQESVEEEQETTENESDTEPVQNASLITEYKWENSADSSLLICETDGSFKYYQSAEDLTNNYFDGTYVFYMGKDAVNYITTELSDYAVTEEELKTLFDNNEEYDESNFVILVLNNEACMVDGENQMESPAKTPYFGFCLESEGVLYLDIANMNSANYHLFVAK